MQRLSRELSKGSAPLLLMLGLVSGMGLSLYSPFDLLDTQEALWRGLLGFVLGVGFAWAGPARITKRGLLYALLPAGLLAISCVVGAELQVYGGFRMDASAALLGILCWLGLTALFSLGLCLLIFRGGHWLHRLRESRLEKKLSRFLAPARPCFWRLLGPLLLCWFPLWLAYFPGLSNYDVLSHLSQCVTNEYSTLHPVLYTLFLKGCLLLSSLFDGGTTLALGLLCVTQMLLMACAIAFALSSLRRWGAPAWACLLGLALFALFPVFPLLTMSTIKDTPYAAFALVFAVEALRLFKEPEPFLQSPKAWASLVLSGVFLCLFRYNGVVSLLLWMLPVLLLFWFVQKSPQRWGLTLRLFCLFGLVIGLTFGANTALNTAVNAAPSFVTQRDMASLPSQQMIRTALLMEEDSPEYQDVMQWYSTPEALTAYRPWLADYTKYFINVDHDNGWRGFVYSWLRTGLRYPKAYVEGFLELNRGLWFVHDVSHANIYLKDAPQVGYLNTQPKSGIQYGDPIVFSSKLPGLQTFLDALTTDNTYLSIPGLRMLFSIGAQSWFCIFLFLGACYRRDRAFMAVTGFFLCQLLLLAFAPAVLARYMLPIFLWNGVGLAAMTSRNPSKADS